MVDGETCGAVPSGVYPALARIRQSSVRFADSSFAEGAFWSVHAPSAVKGCSPFAESPPFPRRKEGKEDRPPWECAAERVNRCGRNNPQSRLARCQLLCQRSLLVCALSSAVRIRNPLELTTPKRPLFERGWHALACRGIAGSRNRFKKSAAPATTLRDHCELWSVVRRKPWRRDCRIPAA